MALPKRQCLAIDGAGSPKDPAFAQAVGALYGTAYTLKFGRKNATKGAKATQDFKVGPLEGRWSADTPPGTTGVPSPERWRWRLRIGVPADVTHQEVERIKRDVVAKKGGKLQGSVAVAQVFLESVPAQRAGRILHIGPYGNEPASFELIADVLEKAGLRAAPTHIEVYLNDPSRTGPDKLKTVLLRELVNSPG
ncbi:MAG TPA: hypothetical protein VHH90_04540 [Polyangia bacterium]|nr:hypothetical protein [Polyangia bacterium]